MDDIFWEEVNEGWLGIYMDDMIIHSENLTQHHQRTWKILVKLQEHDLYLNLKKCYFDKAMVEYLEMIISYNQLEMDPTKVEGILKWSMPETVKQVLGFLEFANFYWRFINKFSDIAKPLNNLTKKNKVFEWTNKCQTAFETLKKCFVTKPVLLMADKTKPFELETDASLYATGGILRQQDNDEHWHPVAYISQSLSETERNYQIYDRELLAIMRAFEEFTNTSTGHPIPSEY